MSNDSPGTGGTGSDARASGDEAASAESAELTRLIVEGFEPVDPHQDVWRRIENQLWRSGKPRRSAALVGFLAVAAAIFLLIGMTGALITIASRESSDAQPAVALQATVIRSLSNPTTGDPELTIHSASDGTSVAVSAGSLPKLDSASTYQLWSVVGDEVVSVGIFGQSIGSAPLRLEGDPSVLALTIESAGGVAVSSATPVAVWTSTG